MSDLVAIAYDNVTEAQGTTETLAKLAKEQNIALDDVVIVEHKEDGKIKLHQSAHLAALGAAGGAVWGGLIGLLFLQPLLGMAVGAASGAAGGALTDTGIDDSFMKDLGEKLPTGGAALFVLFSKVTPDKVLPEIAKHGGHVLQLAEPGPGGRPRGRNGGSAGRGLTPRRHSLSASPARRIAGPAGAVTGMGGARLERATSCL